MREVWKILNIVFGFLERNIENIINRYSIFSPIFGLSLKIPKKSQQTLKIPKKSQQIKKYRVGVV